MNATLPRFLSLGSVGLTVLFMAGLSAMAGIPTTTTSTVVDGGNASYPDNLATSNLSHHLAVGPNGIIHVTWHAGGPNGGILAASSWDNGASFNPAVTIENPNDWEGSVAVASTGIAYVGYGDGNGFYWVARSLDQGLTFQPAVQLNTLPADRGVDVQLTTDGQYVYAIDTNGDYFYVSPDNGLTWTGTNLALSGSPGGAPGVDLMVESGTHNLIIVYPSTNNNVYDLVSADHGATFGVPVALNFNPPFESPIFSLSSGTLGRYLVAAGNGGTQQADLTANGGTPTYLSSFGHYASGSPYGAALAADNYGNMVYGNNQNPYGGTATTGAYGFDFALAYSNFFPLPAIVASSGYTYAGINPTNGDILFLSALGSAAAPGVSLAVTNTGGSGSLLANYELLASTTGLTFNTQTIGTQSASYPVTFTNQSGAQVDINSVAAYGDFSQAMVAGSGTGFSSSSLSPNQAFTTNVTFTPTQSGQRNGDLVISYNNGITNALESRVIALSGTGTGLSGAGAPSVQASFASPSGITATQATLSWSAGNGSNRAVFAKLGNAGTAAPAPFITYAPNGTFGLGAPAGGGWYCVYNGSGLGATIYGLTPGTTYQFFVAEYNGANGAQVYNLSGNTSDPISLATSGLFAVTFATDNTPGAMLSGSSPLSQSISPGAQPGNTGASPVTANAPSGFAFVNWTGNNGFIPTSTNPLTVTVTNTGYNLVANFAAIVPVSVTTNGNGSGSFTLTTYTGPPGPGQANGSSPGTLTGSNPSYSPVVGFTLAGTTPSISISNSGNSQVSDLAINGVSYGAVTSLTFPGPVNAPQNVVVTFTPNASGLLSVVGNTDGNGLLIPGLTEVPNGQCDTFVITPNRGYQLATLTLAPGSPASVLGAVVGSLYAIPSVTNNEVASATFAPNTFTVTAGVGTGSGTITGAINASLIFTPGQLLKYGDTVVFTLSPAPGQNVSSVTVDGIPYAPASYVDHTFTLPSVQADHAITVNFS